MVNEWGPKGRLTQSGTFLSNTDSGKTGLGLSTAGDSTQTALPILTRNLRVFQLLKGGSSNKAHEHQPSHQNGSLTHRDNALVLPPGLKSKVPPIECGVADFL